MMEFPDPDPIWRFVSPMDSAGQVHKTLADKRNVLVDILFPDHETAV